MNRKVEEIGGKGKRYKGKWYNGEKIYKNIVIFARIGCIYPMFIIGIHFLFNRIMVKFSIQKSSKFRSQWLYIPYVY
jgi:hypothetical protein